MSTAPVQKLNQASASGTTARPSSGRWILGSWQDLLLFVWTPLLIAPFMLFLQSPWVGVEVETISMIVVAFGALGHHFPGMIRAYCDRDLFERFRLRFILAPIFLFAIFFPLYQYHPTVMKLILLLWASWHGLMQVYGFVRIYDVKVGSISPVTAYWDWLMCLSWFTCAQFFSTAKMSGFLEAWYRSGGALISPQIVQMFPWVFLAGSVAVLIGFLANHVIQTSRGPKPNSAKLLMLASGIGFWWFAMVGVDNLILGVALFEIFHDIQYLAIVWLYNCRRVNTSSDIGRFMKFLFRRGMLLLYIGLVFAYGLIGLVPRFAQDGTLKTFFTGLIWTSTILHYYYDGFIWKVREKSTQASLGLTSGNASAQSSQRFRREMPHLLKWSPLVALLAWAFLAGPSQPQLSADGKDDRLRRYTTELTGSTVRPQGTEEQSLLYDEFKRVRNIAESVPGDLDAQRRAAIILANFGRNDEAIQLLEKVLKQHPSFVDGHQILGDIHLYRGEYDTAISCFQSALSHAKTRKERTSANLKLGEVYLVLKQFDLAKARFADAVKEDPQLEASINALRKGDANIKSK